MRDTNIWEDEYGHEYEYRIYPIDYSFAEYEGTGGNYIFAERGPIETNEWYPKYIGEISNLCDRLTGHEKEACARRNGATHIHVHVNSNEKTRLNEEMKLVGTYSPVCNG